MQDNEGTLIKLDKNGREATTQYTGIFMKGKK
jgi:hypothetical protein